MSIFKVEFTIWLADGSAGACARDHIGRLDSHLDSWILDWKETEMLLKVAPWVGHMCEGCPECGGKP